MHQFAACRVDPFRATDDDTVGRKAHRSELGEDDAGDLRGNHKQDHGHLTEVCNVGATADRIGQKDVREILGVAMVLINVVPDGLFVPIQDDVAPAV